MKKIYKRFFAFFLAFVMILAMVPVVFAETQDGLSVELKTDKDSYETGDEAAVTVVVKNTGTKVLFNVEVKIELPEGIEFMEGYNSVLRFDKLEPEEEYVEEIKGEVKKTEPTQTDSGKSPGTGDTVSTAFFLLTAVVSAAAAAVYIKKKKRNAAGICMGVLILSVAGLAAPAIASAAVVNADFVVEKTVKIDGKDGVILAKVTYQYEGAEEDSTAPGSDDDNNNNNGDNTGITAQHVTVHDPSIVKDPKTGTYYIFGTHRAWAKSDDLITWTTFTNNLNNDAECRKIFGDAAGWSELGGANYDVTGNLWAPDVVWNETMQKWCMYMSVNGDHWYSSIVLLTADSLDGDWTYVGPVVYSGFTDAEQAAKTDFVKVTGSSVLPNRYLENRNGNHTYGMNAIDPCVFYDEDGTLWMSYGSWFGGIYMLKLDEKTGLRDYGRTYDTVENISDVYQGIKIAGGNHVSGEASYIQHIGEYYYLFMTYGGLESNKGYNMRVFRSENVTGPYTDPSGNDARYWAGNTDAGNVSGFVGVRLMSYYKWSHMSYGYCAEGHNSAFVDDDGRAYIVYHTRFDNQGEGHQVRVHQLFQTKDGWLIAAPYEYAGEELPENGYTAEQVTGRYEILIHRSDIDFANKECVTGQIITLNSDGTISDANGSWKKEDGTPYVTITLDGVNYEGVFIEQTKEETDEKVMTFTLLGNNELTIWGSMLPKEDEKIVADEMAIFSLPTSIMSDLTLKTTGFYGTKITYQSSNPDVLSNAGKINRKESNETVTLSVTFEYGSAVITKDYQIIVIGKGSEKGKILVAEYYTDAPHNLNTPVTVPNPFNKNVTSGLEIYKGVSIEFDIEGTGGINSNVISFNNDINTLGNCLYFTGGSYLGYNATGGYFDANRKKADGSLATDYMEGGARIRIDITDSGFEVYANNELAYSNNTLNADVLNISDDFKGYSVILPWLNEEAAELSFGTGNWWRDDKFNGTISNVKLYANEINEPINQWTYNNYNSSFSYYEDGMKVFAHDGSSGSRGVNTTFQDQYKFTDSYKVELDFAMTAGYAGSKGSNNEFVIAAEGISYLDKNINYGAASNYILKLSTGSIMADSEIYYVNDSSQTVQIPKGKIVHLSMIVDAEGDVQAVFTVDGVSTTVNTHVNGDSKLDGIYLLVGRSQGIIKIGNISVVSDRADISGSENESLPTVTANVTGVAYPDKDSNITVTFTGDKELTDQYPIKINGTSVTKDLEVDMMKVNSISYNGNTCTVQLTMKEVSGWHSIKGSYDIEMVSGNTSLATENVTYALDLSADTAYTTIQKIEENLYSNVYYKIEGTKMSIMTVVKSDKIHSDGVKAGDITYGWSNCINSEIFMTLGGTKYNIGSHMYNGEFVNNMAFRGENTSLVDYETSEAVRGFVALGTFDNDNDVDTGCIILHVVDLAKAGFTEESLKGQTITFSGYMGPNDMGTNGDGKKFVGVDETATYTIN